MAKKKKRETPQSHMTKLNLTRLLEENDAPVIFADLPNHIQASNLNATL